MADQVRHDAVKTLSPRQTAGDFFYILGMTKLDEILQSLNASNHDLVEMLPVNLNHKMVQKARLGKKPVPKHTQDLILQALNKFLLQNAVTEDKKVKQYKRVELFGE